MAVRSTYNNRLAPLIGLGSFTGEAEETKLGNALSVAVYISDLSTLTIEQSPNRTNWYIMKQTTIEPNVRYIIQEPCTLAYFRITIHNEMLTAQAYCNLVTSLVQELTQGVDIRPLSSATDSVTVSNLPDLQLVAGQNSNFNFYPTVDNNTIQIYADGTKGNNVTGGWQYTNTAANKINWYIYQAPTSGGNPTTAGQTVASVKSMYAVINQQSTLGLAQAQNPWIMIYTIPDSGVNASFYKSKLFYGSNAHTDISGNKLLYTGTDPSGVHPEITGINRIKLDFNLSLSTKSEAAAANELVGAGTLQTTALTPAGQFNFTMQQFGVDWEKVNTPLPIENGKVQIEGTVTIASGTSGLATEATLSSLNTKVTTCNTNSISGVVGVTGTVGVTGDFYPATQPVSGIVGITGPVGVTGDFYPATQPVSGIVGITGSLPAGTEIIGKVYTFENSSSVISLGPISILGQMIRSSPGSLFDLTCFNDGNAISYLKIYNKATAANSADIPIFTLPILHDSPINTISCHNVLFDAGISVRATASFDPTNNVAPNGNTYVTAFYNGFTS